MKSPESYVGKGGSRYSPFTRRGFTVVECLPFLKGRPWDETALAYVHALRPAFVRVSKGEVTSDSLFWRVTVYVTDDGAISCIEQEVEVGLPDGISHGHELRCSLGDAS